MIAEERLTPAAKASIHELLGADVNISDADVAIWAHQIRRDRNENAGGVGLLDNRTEIVQLAAVVRALQQQPECAIHRHRRRIADVEADIQRFGAAPEHVERLRERVL